MAMIYARIKHLQIKKKFLQLTHDQKIDLGRKFNELAKEKEYHRGALQKVPSSEPEGDYLVVSYPRKYIPNIDRFILEYFHSLTPVKPPRKRIQRPVFTTRKLS